MGEKETENDYQRRIRREHELALVKARRAWVWPVCIAMVFIVAILGDTLTSVLR